MKRLLTLAIVLAACKSKPAPTTTTTTTTEKHDEHANMPAEIVKFHDILSPRWHAEKGPQRMKDTCAAIGDFTTTADAVSKVATPANGDAAKWQAGTKELVDAVGALKATCDKPDEVAFEDAFHRVHEDFHAVAELAGGENEHHEEHHEEHHDEKAGH